MPPHSQFALAAILAVLGMARPALACVPALPPPRAATESEEAYLARLKAIEAEALAYQQLPQREKDRREQVGLWDGYTHIFLARVERINVKGKLYPPPPPKPVPQPAKNAGPKPPILVPVPPVPAIGTGESHRAFLRPIRWIKGPRNFTPSWHWVGSRTSCGNMMEGELSVSHPGDTVVVFANKTFEIDAKGRTMPGSQDWSIYAISQREIADSRLRGKR